MDVLNVTFQRQIITVMKHYKQKRALKNHSQSEKNHVFIKQIRVKCFSMTLSDQNIEYFFTETAGDPCRTQRQLYKTRGSYGHGLFLSALVHALIFSVPHLHKQHNCGVMSTTRCLHTSDPKLNSQFTTNTCPKLKIYVCNDNGDLSQLSRLKSSSHIRLLLCTRSLKCAPYVSIMSCM